MSKPDPQEDGIVDFGEAISPEEAADLAEDAAIEDYFNRRDKGSYFTPAPAPQPTPKPDKKEDLKKPEKPKPEKKERKRTTQQPREITFSETLARAKGAAANINPNAVFGMSESEAIKYTQQSIADLEQKMAAVNNLSDMNTMTTNNKPGNQQALSNTTQVSNNIMNSTSINYDYLRTLRSDYEKTPQWRGDMG